MATRSALAAVVLCVGLAGCLGFLAPEPESFAGAYDYSLGLDVEGTVSNVTVYVPLASGPDGPAFDEGALVPNGTVDGVFAAAVVEAEYGPMLALTADRIEVQPRYYAVRERDGVGERVEIDESEYDPANPNHQRVAFRSVSVLADRAVEYPVETRDPVGTEPVFPTTGARVRTPCSRPVTDGAVCYRYDAPVYLSYDTTPDTTLSLVVTFEGRNEWFAGGWTGNGYREHVSFRATGPANGWMAAEGELVTGNGNYRDG